MGTILVYNDDAEIALCLEQSLLKEGHIIKTCHGVLDAVSKALTMRFTALILNLDSEKGKGACLIPLVNTLDDSIAVITLTRVDSLELQRLTRKGKVFFHALWPQDRQTISLVVNNAQVVAARIQKQERNTSVAIRPSFLKKRIGRHISVIRDELTAPCPGNRPNERPRLIGER